MRSFAEAVRNNFHQARPLPLEFDFASDTQKRIPPRPGSRAALINLSAIAPFWLSNFLSQVRWRMFDSPWIYIYIVRHHQNYAKHFFRVQDDALSSTVLFFSNFSLRDARRVMTILHAVFNLSRNYFLRMSGDRGKYNYLPQLHAVGLPTTFSFYFF